MTFQSFVDLCEKSFSDGKVRLGEKQSEIYAEKLRRFSGDQLDKIFESVLESCRNFPKISDIYNAAKELGFVTPVTDSFKPHHWEHGDCKLCRGEGRLSVTWELSFTEDRREQHSLKQIHPYSDQATVPPDCFTSIYRCSCAAGDRPSIPKAWPLWSKDREPVRVL